MAMMAPWGLEQALGNATAYDLLYLLELSSVVPGFDYFPCRYTTAGNE